MIVPLRDEMPLTIVTPPADLAINPAHVKEHLRVDPQPTDDFLIEEYIEAAVQRLDGRDGILGRALITQVWKLTLDCFLPTIAVPLPPLQTVDEIKYLDADGVEQTLATTEYAVYSTDPAFIQPAVDKTWPTTQSVPEAVRIQFTCGYGIYPSDVPANIRAALAMDAAHLYENRETLLIGTSAVEYPHGYMDRIANYRNWSF